MNKYHNKKIIIDGITFDSIKEGERWCELKALEKKGIISELDRQKKFELQPAFYHNGKKQRAVYYICDFYYKEGDQYIIEDVKSPITKNNGVYKLKKKRMMFLGYDIREV